MDDLITSFTSSIVAVFTSSARRIRRLWTGIPELDAAWLPSVPFPATGALFCFFFNKLNGPETFSPPLPADLRSSDTSWLSLSLFPAAFPLFLLFFSVPDNFTSLLCPVFNSLIIIPPAHCSSCFYVVS